MNSIIVDTNVLVYIYSGIPNIGRRYAELLGDLSAKYISFNSAGNRCTLSITTHFVDYHSFTGWDSTQLTTKKSGVGRQALIREFGQ